MILEIEIVFPGRHALFSHEIYPDSKRNFEKNSHPSQEKAIHTRNSFTIYDLRFANNAQRSCGNCKANANAYFTPEDDWR